MKIVYFNYLYDLYEGAIGSTIKAIELLNALESRGHEIKFYWLNAERKNGKNTLKLYGYRKYFKKYFDKFLHEPNQIFKNGQYYFKEYKILKNEKPDLVISRLDVYLVSTLLVTRILRLPWVVEADSPEVYEYRKFYTHYKKLPLIDGIIERLNLRVADRVFVVSNLVREYFIKKRKIVPSKIAVIPNAADAKKYQPSHRDRSIVNEYKLNNFVVLGFIGSFHYWHGVENLIRIIDKIVPTEKGAKFLLVGSGGAKESEIRNFVKKKGYGDNVIFTGSVPHSKVGQYISVMDIVLAPYPQLEFFYFSPMKLYEYMASGKAIVASNMGQIGEIIYDGENGLLYDPDDIESMIGGIRQLIKDTELRHKLGANARDSIIEYHNWNSRAKKLEILCKNTLLDHRDGKR